MIARGDSFTRGQIIGGATGERVRRFIETRPAEWREPARPTVAELTPFIERHAPETMAELEGFASGAGLPLDDVLRLATDYDRFMYQRAGPGKCTAFAAMGAATIDGSLVCGQNNDEGPEWLEFEMDMVAHHLEPTGLETLIYTHAGMPAYMGMNSAGLCVLWMFINNRDIGPGVPTVVLIREMLRKRSLDGAVDWLRQTPRTCPNAFVLAHATDGISSVECSHRQFELQRSAGTLAHANHILHPRLAEADAFRGQSSNTSFPRQCRMERLLAEHDGRIDVAAGRSFLRDRQGGPSSILARPEDGHGWQTLASMVFHPAAGEMSIAFGNGPNPSYERHAFGHPGQQEGAAAST